MRRYSGSRSSLSTKAHTRRARWSSGRRLSRSLGRSTTWLRLGRCTRGRPPNFRLRRADLGGREIEQDVVHLGIVAATLPLGNPPAERFTASPYIKAAEDDLVRVSDESVARRIIPGRAWLGISQRL